MKIDNGKDPVQDANYQLGKTFTLMFKVRDNETECYYNFELKIKYKKLSKIPILKRGLMFSLLARGRRKWKGN
ncbi:hypothetical protein AAKU52_002474 [Pedobacter sp. CG_S7]|uniref:hypothetical protein n=1 Tax=Pedobacter sp. CG_S7 TaxID=3143930 RepID=UPI003394EE18